MNDLRACQVCCNEYGGTVVPTMLICCLNQVCFGCAEKDRNAKIALLTGNRKMIKCMLCNQEFHSSKETPWKVNKPFIESNSIEVDLSAVKEAQVAMQQSASSAPNNRRRNPRRDVQESMQETMENNQQEEEEAEGLVERPQKRSRRNRNSDRTALALPASEEDSQNLAGMQLSEVVNDGRTETEESTDTQDEGDEDAKSWLNIVLSVGVSVYRVRVSQKASIRKEGDQYGRKCSFWCIKNGYVSASACMLRVLPKEIQHDGEACKAFIRDEDCESLRKRCKECKPYFAIFGQRYTLSFRYFVEMKPGDIVVMQVKGKKGVTPHPFLVFGVIQDDSLVLMSKDEARKEHGHPWDFKKDGDSIPAYDNGIMLRKVKWLRQGVLQEVRGLSQADWLGESQTIWMANVKGDENKLLKKAIGKMKSKKFIESTKKIEEEWIDIGLTGK